MKSKYYSRGYTLIEMIIVLAIISLILPMMFSMMYVVLRQQLKIYQLIETKREGDRVMAFIKENILREAAVIKDNSGTTRCANAFSSYSPNLYAGTPQEMRFVRISDGAYFAFTTQDNKFFYSINGVETALNKSTVKVENISFSCYQRSAYTKPLVQISFDVTYNDVTGGSDGTITLSYKTKLRLRN